MEKHILALESAGDKRNLDEDDMEDKALELAIDEVYEANGRKWKPWAKNARSIRMGDIILLVDSDTVVPEVSCSVRLVARRFFLHLNFVFFFLLLFHYRIALGMLRVNLLKVLMLLLSNTNQARFIFTAYMPFFFG
jgi:hypothetical protein